MTRGTVVRFLLFQLASPLSRAQMVKTGKEERELAIKHEFSNRSPHMLSRCSFSLLILLTALCQVGSTADSPDHRYLYVVCPGIRDYLEFGGAGILVFDIDHGHALVKRIQTPASREGQREDVR